MHREAGFSLIEMMVVLTIMALTATLVMLSAPGGSNSLAADTDRLLADLSAARDLAVIENRNVTVEISEQGYQTRVLSRLGPGAVSQSVAWPDGTTVGAPDGRLPAIVMFDPIGLSAPAAFTLYRHGHADGVEIGASGEIRRLADAA